MICCIYSLNYHVHHENQVWVILTTIISSFTVCNPGSSWVGVRLSSGWLYVVRPIIIDELNNCLVPLKNMLVGKREKIPSCRIWIYTLLMDNSGFWGYNIRRILFRYPYLPFVDNMINLPSPFMQFLCDPFPVAFPWEPFLTNDDRGLRDSYWFK